MIHLVNGGSTLQTLKETSVAGDKYSIDDILMEGPIVDGLGTESSWELRAEYLERYFSIPGSGYLDGKTERDRVLSESLTHEEIVLWFEFDLHCQTNLLYFLAWFGSHARGRVRLSLICPETFPGRDRFKGLGELHAQELELLFPRRMEVTSEQMNTALAAWQAYGNADPREVELFLQTDSRSLPLVAPALRAHLERFPSVANGLGILAQKTLEILSAEPLGFPQLFRRVSDTPEIHRHGMGDLGLQAYLKMWATGVSPLIAGSGPFEITRFGRSVIETREDAIRPEELDLWLGGVHLSPNNVWRWDTRLNKIKKGPSQSL
jgi:hypothetical protein